MCLGAHPARRKSTLDCVMVSSYGGRAPAVLRALTLIEGPSGDVSIDEISSNCSSKYFHKESVGSRRNCLFHVDLHITTCLLVTLTS